MVVISRMRETQMWTQSLTNGQRKVSVPLFQDIKRTMSPNGIAWTVKHTLSFVSITCQVLVSAAQVRDMSRAMDNRWRESDEKARCWHTAVPAVNVVALLEVSMSSSMP